MSIRVEQRAAAFWRWVGERVTSLWTGAVVRPVRYSGVNHRYCGILLPTGGYHVLGITEAALERTTLDELARQLESSSWLERLRNAGCPGLLVRPGGVLEEWMPRAGAASV